MKLRTADPGEHAVLTELCLRSKAFWGYDRAFMDLCRDELTLDTAACASPDLIVAEQGGTVVGLAQIAVEADGCYLEKLFVDPGHHGKGLGTELFRWAASRARALGQHVMIIEADPGAEAFYLRCGAIRNGDTPSGSIGGRLLPRLEFALD